MPANKFCDLASQLLSILSNIDEDKKYKARIRNSPSCTETTHKHII